MSSKYSTIQQHEPLRVPSGWGAQEKRFISQLEEIFDDLYSRFNRLKMSDLSQGLQAVIKSGVDGVSELRTELTQTEAEIALKASQSSVDALTGRVSSAESSITQQAGQIAAKVSQETYTQDMAGVTRRISSAETAITQKADGIELTALRTHVDGMRVGGTNLLPGGEAEMVDARFLYVDVGDALSAYVGEEICVSFDCRTQIAREIRCYPYQDSGVSIKDTYRFTPSTEWTRFSFATEAKDFGRIVGANTGRIGWYDDAGAQSISIRRVKIELGTMPTDWSPAPEDPVERVENTSVLINPSGVTMRGGRMDFEAGSEFKLKSGGIFNVYAKSDDSTIRFGGTDAEHPNFSLGAGGQVIAKKIFTEELEVTGGGLLPILLAGSLANQIIVSDTQPTNVHGVLWFDTSGGGGSGTLDYTLAQSGGEDMTPADNTVTLTGFAPGAGSVSGNCTYGVQFRIYNYSGTCAYYKITVSLSNGTNTVTVLDETVNQWVRPGDYFDVNTLNTPSSAMANITGGNLSMTVRLQKFDSNHDPVATGARFEVGQPFTIRAVGSAGQGTTQVCTVKYIP